MSEDWENEEFDDGLPDFGLAPVSSLRRPTARDSAGVLVTLRAPAVAQELISLDGFWTAELARLREADAASGAETAVIQEVGVDLQIGLQDVRGLAEDLLLMLERDLSDEDINEALARLSTESQTDLTSEWQEALHGESLRDVAIGACTYIIENAPLESAEIAGKLVQLRAGSIPEGTFKKLMICSLTVFGTAAVVAGAATTVPFVVLPAVATMAGTVAVGAAAWVAADCHGPMYAWRQRRRRRPEAAP